MSLVIIAIAPLFSLVPYRNLDVTAQFLTFLFIAEGIIYKMCVKRWELSSNSLTKYSEWHFYFRQFSSSRCLSIPHVISDLPKCAGEQVWCLREVRYLGRSQSLFSTGKNLSISCYYVVAQSNITISANKLINSTFVLCATARPFQPNQWQTFEVQDQGF